MSSAVVCFSSPLVAASLSIPCLKQSKNQMDFGVNKMLVITYPLPVNKNRLGCAYLATSRGPYPGLSLEVGGRSDMAVVMVPAKEGVLLTDKEEVEGWRVLAFLVC